MHLKTSARTLAGRRPESAAVGSTKVCLESLDALFAPVLLQKAGRSEGREPPSGTNEPAAKAKCHCR